MLEFVAILIGLALLWQLRRTDFGKAMFVLLGFCALSLVIVASIETITTVWKQRAVGDAGDVSFDDLVPTKPPPKPNVEPEGRAPAFDPDEYLRTTRDLGLPPPPEPAPVCLDDACIQAPRPGKPLTDAEVRLPPPVDPAPPSWQVQLTEEQRLSLAQGERAGQEWQAAIETRRQQDAQADLERRRRAASRKIEVISTNVECRLNLSCGLFTLTVRVRNQSSEAISSLSVGWAFMAAADDLLCPNSLPTKHKERINLNPGDTTVLNIDGHDGLASKRFRYCVNATGVELQ